MAVLSIVWSDKDGNTDFTFNQNTSSVSTWITVVTDTSESTSRTFPITMYRGIAEGGGVEVTTLTATYVRTESGARQYQAFYKFDLEDWLQYRPADNNYVSVWVNSVDSLYVGANVYFSFIPTIISATVTSNLPDPSVFVQGVSSYNYRVEAEGYDGAEITSARARIETQSATSLTKNGEVWTGTKAAMNMTSRAAHVHFTVTDVHQVNATTDTIITIQAHGDPVITTDIFRCDATGEKDEDGAYLSVTAYANSTPAIVGIYSLHLEGVISGTQSSIISQYINSGETYIFGNGGIVSTDSYNLTFVAVDNSAAYGGTAKTATLEVGVPKLVRIINIKDGGTGVAFGKLATEDALTDSAWDINTDGEYLVQGEPLVDTLPNASASVRGLVSTGAQTFAGVKTFSGNEIRISHPITSAGYLQFFDSNGNGSAYLRDRTSSSHRLDFLKRSYNSSDNSLLSTFETYALPNVDADRTASADYNILTSKSPVTIAQGGSGQTATNHSTVATNMTLTAWGKNRMLDFNNYTVSYTTIVTLSDGNRPNTVAHGVCRWRHTNNTYYPALVTIASTGVVSASYWNGTSATAISNGTLTGTISWIAK